MSLYKELWYNEFSDIKNRLCWTIEWICLYIKNSFQLLWFTLQKVHFIEGFLQNSPSIVDHPRYKIKTIYYLSAVKKQAEMNTNIRHQDMQNTLYLLYFTSLWATGLGKRDYWHEHWMSSYNELLIHCIKNYFAWPKEFFKSRFYCSG